MSTLCLQMDGRHNFVTSKLADATGLDVTQVEEFMVGDDNVSVQNSVYYRTKTRVIECNV